MHPTTTCTSFAAAAATRAAFAAERPPSAAARAPLPSPPSPPSSPESSLIIKPERSSSSSARPPPPPPSVPDRMVTMASFEHGCGVRVAIVSSTHGLSLSAACTTPAVYLKTSPVTNEMAAVGTKHVPSSGSSLNTLPSSPVLTTETTSTVSKSSSGAAASATAAVVAVDGAGACFTVSSTTLSARSSTPATTQRNVDIPWSASVRSHARCRTAVGGGTAPLPG